MERMLVLIRHAKSDWGMPGQVDYERPLNERGRKDAPVMGARLREKGVVPDLIISSPARRAAQTARLVAEALDYPENTVRWEERLYHCTAKTFEEVIVTSIDEQVKTVFIFGHNPGITHFANDITRSFSVDNIPTCGMVAIRFQASTWSEFAATGHELLFFDYPKNQ